MGQRKELMIFFILLQLAGLAPAQEGRATHVKVPVMNARQEDVKTIDAVINAYYEVISGPAGQPRQWARDRSLYIEGVRFVSAVDDKQGRPQPEINTHQQFVDRTNEVLVARGFYEKEIHRVTERFGNIAHVFSTYESRIKQDGPVIARGINSIELFWDDERWWIASAIWDDERPGKPIPAEYLPASSTK